MREIIFVVKKVDYTSLENVSIRGSLTCQIHGDAMRITKYVGIPILFADCQQEAYGFAQSNNISYIIADSATEYIKLDAAEISWQLEQCGFYYRNNGINQCYIRNVKLK